MNCNYVGTYSRDQKSKSINTVNFIISKFDLKDINGTTDAVPPIVYAMKLR